jgi:hypothetical protein
MLVAVFGHQRSGTTVLRLVLDGHPAIGITNEVGLLRALDRSFPAHARYTLRQLRAKRNISAISGHGHGRLVGRVKGLGMIENGWFAARYLGALGRGAGAGVVDAAAVERALRSTLGGAEVVGDKHPDYWFATDRLATTPGVRCVCIYRDPRDVTASCLEKSRGAWNGYWAPEMADPAGVAERWVRMMGTIERNPDRVHVIRFEDFARQPEPELRRLAQFLDVDPAGFDARTVHGGSIGRYRTSLTDDELAAVVRVAGPTMERYGYTV